MYIFFILANVINYGKVIIMDLWLILSIVHLITGDKSVLWASIDERNVLKDTSNGVECRRRNLSLILVQRWHEILRRVVKTSRHIAVSFCVGRP